MWLIYLGESWTLIRSIANSAKHIEFCGNEIRKCVSMANATTDRVIILRKGFARLEAQIASEPSFWSGDVSLTENRILASVLSKVDEEWNKTMAEEGKHTIHTYGSLRSLVQKLDLDLMSLKEKRTGEFGQYCCCFVWWRGKWEVVDAFGELVWRHANVFYTYETRV